MALEIKDLGVKFYASKTRQQALALPTTPLYNEKGEKIADGEPGAICFVSDSKGNSIILNGKIFGDGATGGGGSIIADLSDLIVVEVDGKIIKTLADYFAADGTVISDSFKVTTTDDEGNSTDIIVINKDGIKIGTETVSTKEWVNIQISNNNTTILLSVAEIALQKAEAAEKNAKDYADSIIASVYKVKGSLNNIGELNSLTGMTVGDVYNIKTTGMNYVYTDEGWDSLGGTFDTSNFKTAAETDAAIATALEQAKQYSDGNKLDIQNSLDLISGTMSRIDERVTNNANNIALNASSIATNANNIASNTTNIINIATQLTWQ